MDLEYQLNYAYIVIADDALFKADVDFFTKGKDVWAQL